MQLQYEDLSKFNLKDLPFPYSSLTTLRPLMDHGWYSNAPQLHTLMQMHPVYTIVEIGVWLGKSAMDLARHLPDGGVLYAVDHFQGSQEHQIGASSWHPCVHFLYEQFLSNVIHNQLTDTIIPIPLTSAQAAPFLSHIQPDLIYIDASHDTDSLYQDLVLWYPRVAHTGILCGDDWCWESVRKAVRRFASEHQLMVVFQENFWQLIE